MQAFKKLFTVQNLNIFFISLILFLSPLIVNYSDLPKGFEIPKVHFLNIAVLILTGFFILSMAKNNVLERIKNPVSFIIVAVILFVFILSTLVSSYQPISLHGNSFRDQGLIFYTLVILAAFIAYLNVNRINFKFIILSIYLSAVIQSISAAGQYFELLNKRPSLLDDGLWINGTYGQANFFSTHLVVGFICGIFLLNWIRKRADKKFRKIILSALFLLGLILIILLTIASYSIFGWITLAVSAAIIIMYKLIPRKHFYNFFFIIFFTALIVGVYLLITEHNNLRIEIWKTSLIILFDQLKVNPLKFLFGFGFDTLGEVFKSYSQFQGSIIDRGHNIFIDIVMQIGVVGLGIFTALILLIIKKSKSIFQNSELFLEFLLVFIFILKTFIHEYSAVNFFCLIILIGALLGRINYQDQE